MYPLGTLTRNPKVTTMPTLLSMTTLRVCHNDWLRWHQWWQDWTNNNSWVGVTEPISSIPLLSEFFIIFQTHVRNWILHLCETGIAAAQLRWYLSNMNVIQRIRYLVHARLRILLTEDLLNGPLVTLTPGLQRYFQCKCSKFHYNDVIISTIACQITCLTIVNSSV